MPETHYEVLGVAVTATLKDIRKAYQRLARRWHPDLSAHLADSAQRTAANERFKLITAAYNTLNDTDQRRQYDATLQPAKPAHRGYNIPPSATFFDFSSPSDYFDTTGPLADYFRGDFYAPPQTNKEQEESLRQARERMDAQAQKSKERVEHLMRETDERVARLVKEAYERTAKLVREADERTAKLVSDANERTARLLAKSAFRRQGFEGL